MSLFTTSTRICQHLRHTSRLFHASPLSLSPSQTLRRLRTPKSSKMKKRPQEVSFLSRIQTYKAWKQQGFQPNYQLYLEYMHYCVEEAYEHPERSLITAESLLRDMATYNVAPDVEIFNRYLQCAVRGSNVERALEIFAEMTEKRGIAPNQNTFSAMIRVHALNEQKEEARKYFDAMVERKMVRGDILDFDDIYFALKTL